MGINRILKELENITNPHMVREIHDNSPAPEGYVARALPAAVLEAGKLLAQVVGDAPEEMSDYTPDMCAAIGGKCMEASMLMMQATSAFKRLHDKLQTETN